ncbi:hypothetical protein C8F01DRAFT_1178103 [Mycena amicta]|nr:hypothetical protein C8F01DRAFT_1178103 [Mycena amicta]
MTSTLPIPHSQRLRFIRSMKKLGDLLTETQTVLTDVPMPNAHTRTTSASFFSPSSVDSTCASPSSSRTFFSLRLPTAKSPGPLSATFSLNSPATPITPAAIDPETLKARNLAKVSATLGENVPPELVSKGRKRSSTVSVPEYSTSPGHPGLIAGSVARRGHRTRPSRPVLKHAASSSSLSHPPPAPEDEPFSYATLVAASASANAVTVPVLFASTPNTKKNTYRKEACWSGEWSGSVRNMDDVVRGLRELRA